MSGSSIHQDKIDKCLVVLYVLVLVKLLIHLWTNAFASYGIFRDEFYYLACSHRLGLGYVDQPPLSIYVLSLSRAVFGDSLFALRLIPALAGAATVLVTGLIARRLGGSISAVVIACLAAIAAPVYLGMNTIYSMNSFDILFWTLASYFLVLVIKENTPRDWLLLGVMMGLGMLNKIGMIWFCFGLVVSLLVTKQRTRLATKWPYLCFLVAFLLFLPYLIWNILNDFAHVEFIKNATTQKYDTLSPLDFITGQLLNMNPVTIPVWLSGVFYFFFGREGRNFRPLGIIYVTAFLILVINGHSKAEYLAPAYTMLFAAGGVQMGKSARKKMGRWLIAVSAVAIFIFGVIIAPLALPCLPVNTYVRYARSIGFAPESAEGKELSELPQFYADMFGWEEMAKTASEVYTSLPEEIQRTTFLFAQNYGQAGAIEYYTQKYVLPPVLSSHNNYWIWGRDQLDNNYNTVIILGGELNDHLYYLKEVEQAAVFQCQQCMPYENNLPVFVGRGFKQDLRELWPEIKHYE